MRPLGPIEAFQPALERTRSILFRPFRLGRSWKLAFCAYVAFCGSFFLPLPLLIPAIPEIRGKAFIWVAAILFTLFTFGPYYLGSRLQFILLDLVVTLEDRIVPLWRSRPASLVWRWIGIKLGLTLPLALLVFLPILPLARRLGPLLPQAFPADRAAGAVATGTPTPDPAFLLALFSVYGVLLAGMSLLFLASSLLSDFVLPFLALEGGTARSALRQARSVFAADPSSCFGFVGFQIVLTLIGLVAVYTAATALSLLLAIPLLLLALAGYLLLHTLSPVLLVVGGVLLYAIFIGCSLYLQLGLFGILMVFLRAYSLIFLGGLFPVLGALLNPSPPPPPLAIDPHPSPYLPTDSPAG